MACVNPISIKEIIEEQTKPGVFTEINVLAKTESSALLADIAKTVNQLPEVVSADGVGTYGLSKQNLEDLGIIKKGLNTSDDPNDLEAILSDPSIFTGKDDILNLDILKGSTRQRKLTQEILIKNTNNLEQQGIISGTETSAEYASLASLSMKFPTNVIKDFLAGIGDLDVLNKMSDIASSAAYAIDLVNNKAASLLNGIKGIGRAVVKLPTLAADTIKVPSLNIELDKFIGSKKIASAIKESDLVSKVKDKGLALIDIKDIF